MDLNTCPDIKGMQLMHRMRDIALRAGPATTYSVPVSSSITGMLRIPQRMPNKSISVLCGPVWPRPTWPAKVYRRIPDYLTIVGVERPYIIRHGADIDHVAHAMRSMHSTHIQRLRFNARIVIHF